MGKPLHLCTAFAGYTSGGAPYGITWEQARKEGPVEEKD